MDHLAVMDKRLGLLEKILNREKTIESRWSKSKRVPWGKIKKGETIFFKNTGSLVTAKAQTTKIIQLENLTEKQIKKILSQYKEKLGLTQEMFSDFYQRIRNRKYGTLIFLSSPQKIKPFQINKKGYGAMSAWICVEDIREIVV